MGVFSFKNGVAFFAEESTPGTLETFAGSHGGLAISNPQPNIDVGRQQREILLPQKGTLASLATTFSGGLTFNAELKGGPSLGVAPKAGAILKMAGFQETLDPGVDVQYDLADNDVHHSMALHLHDGSGGAIQFASAGALANVVFSVGAIGEFIQMACTAIGAYVPVADVSEISTTIETKAPPVFRSGLFTVGGFALKVRSFSLDIGNQIILDPLVDSPSGFALARISQRTPTLTFEAELEKVSVHDFYGLVASDIENALVIRTEDTNNNTIRFDASKLNYITPTLGDSNNAPTVQMQAEINYGGANELKITID
ncbi:MAG: hypothetical protein NPIRA02_29540 [Nitrospirales bacterium]|nr:MAG: hypothetical protein NPIRA02_29540 [Nitrospirales bacterium]